jgi:hypothetical protein
VSLLVERAVERDMAVPSKLILYKKNDQYVEISGLADGLTAAYMNAATVTATLKARDGTNVTGLTNITLSYVAASDGVYRGQVAETFDPTAGGGYTLHIDATQGSTTAHLEIPVEIKIRKT